MKKVATADDVAETLVWLCEGAPTMTGETVIVDAGLHLGRLPPHSGGRR